MNPQEWKASVTGPGNCPDWCESDHADEDVTAGDSVIHVSAPVTVDVTGHRHAALRIVEFSLASAQSRESTRRPPYVEALSSTYDAELTTREMLVSAAEQLEHAAAQLRAWCADVQPNALPAS